MPVASSSDFKGPSGAQNLTVGFFLDLDATRFHDAFETAKKDYQKFITTLDGKNKGVVSKASKALDDLTKSMESFGQAVSQTLTGGPKSFTRGLRDELRSVAQDFGQALRTEIANAGVTGLTSGTGARGLGRKVGTIVPNAKVAPPAAASRRPAPTVTPAQATSVRTPRRAQGTGEDRPRLVLPGSNEYTDRVLTMISKKEPVLTADDVPKISAIERQFDHILKTQRTFLNLIHSVPQFAAGTGRSSSASSPGSTYVGSNPKTPYGKAITAQTLAIRNNTAQIRNLVNLLGGGGGGGGTGGTGGVGGAGPRRNRRFMRVPSNVDPWLWQSLQSLSSRVAGFIAPPIGGMQDVATLSAQMGYGYQRNLPSSVGAANYGVNYGQAVDMSQALLSARLNTQDVKRVGRFALGVSQAYGVPSDVLANLAAQTSAAGWDPLRGPLGVYNMARVAPDASREMAAGWSDVLSAATPYLHKAGPEASNQLFQLAGTVASTIGGRHGARTSQELMQLFGNALDPTNTQARAAFVQLSGQSPDQMLRSGNLTQGFTAGLSRLRNLWSSSPEVYQAQISTISKSLGISRDMLHQLAVNSEKLAIANPADVVRDVNAAMEDLRAKSGESVSWIQNLSNRFSGLSGRIAESPLGQAAAYAPATMSVLGDAAQIATSVGGWGNLVSPIKQGFGSGPFKSLSTGAKWVRGAGVAGGLAGTASGIMHGGAAGWAGAGLTGLGTLMTATGVGAPIGVAMMVAGTLLPAITDFFTEETASGGLSDPATVGILTDIRDVLYDISAGNRAVSLRDNLRTSSGTLTGR